MNRLGASRQHIFRSEGYKVRTKLRRQLTESRKGATAGNYQSPRGQSLPNVGTTNAGPISRELPNEEAKLWSRSFSAYRGYRNCCPQLHLVCVCFAPLPRPGMGEKPVHTQRTCGSPGKPKCPGPMFCFQNLILGPLGIVVCCLIRAPNAQQESVSHVQLRVILCRQTEPTFRPVLNLSFYVGAIHPHSEARNFTER